MITVGDLFAGGGGISQGARMAGLRPIWAIEYNNDPKVGPPDCIAEVYSMNCTADLIIKRVQDVSPQFLDAPDILCASPPCPSFSVAKIGREETTEDRSAAGAICRFLRALQPKAFLLENVMGYRTSQSLALIRSTLDQLGYWSQESIVNSADFGVPQTRKRFILRAVRNGMLPPLPTPLPWIGWYEAIEDLLPTLPESQFAPWQLRRLPQGLDVSSLVEMRNLARAPQTRPPHAPAWTLSASDGRRASSVPHAFLLDQSPAQLNFMVEGTCAGEDNKFALPVRTGDKPIFTVRGGTNKPRAFLMPPVNADGTALVRQEDQPSHTVMSTAVKQMPRAFLVDCQNSGNPDAEGERGLTIRQAADPAFVITANQNKRTGRAWLDAGRVVSMSPRALARFQSFPDSFVLPAKTALACRVIGNAAPPLLMAALLRGLADAIA